MKRPSTVPAVCSIDFALELIARRWKPAIVWSLRVGPRRFSELQQVLTGISHKILIENLRELVRDGVVTRQRLRARYVQYALTDLGERLLPVLDVLDEFGTERQRATGRRTLLTFNLPRPTARAEPNES